MKEINAESQVYELLESLEISAACPDCGKLSLAIMNNSGECPYCEDLRNTIASLRSKLSVIFEE